MARAYEIIRFRKEGEYFDIQLAVPVAGRMRLAPPFEVHASQRELYPPTNEGDTAFLGAVARNSAAMLEQYGDLAVYGTIQE